MPTTLLRTNHVSRRSCITPPMQKALCDVLVEQPSDELSLVEVGGLACGPVVAARHQGPDKPSPFFPHLCPNLLLLFPISLVTR